MPVQLLLRFFYLTASVAAKEMRQAQLRGEIIVVKRGPEFAYRQSKGMFERFIEHFPIKNVLTL